MKGKHWLPFFYTFMRVISGMRTLFTFFFVWLAHVGFSQFQIEPDTVYYNNSPLSNLDSSDIQQNNNASVVDGGFSLMNVNSYGSEAIINLILGHGISHENYHFQAYRFSAIPYLGFAFGFGAQGTTDISVNYAQAFTDSTLLNINYIQNGSNGFLRNSAFKKNNLELRFRHLGRIYSARMDASYHKGVYNHCGGLLDTLTPGFGLEFQRIAKKNANSAFVNGLIDFQQYLDFIPGTENAFGLKFQHTYSIHNRKFHEIDTLTGLYDQVYLNADTTSDQYNLASIENGVGIFYTRKGFTIEGGPALRYWSYLNFENQKDSVELNVRAMTQLLFAKFKLNSDAYFNLFGAYNEWMMNANLDMRFSSKSRLLANMRIGAVAPKQFQRFYLANNYQYNLIDITTQGLISLKGDFHQVVKDSTMSFNASLYSSTITNPYVFSDSTWDNKSVSSISVLGISVKGELNFWKMSIQPNLNYYISNASFIPDYLVGTRLLFRAKLFAGKKLAFAGGVDVSYRSSLSEMTYVPSLDVFDLINTGANLQARENLHVFANFGIKDFSFYIRAENLAYFWKDESISEMNAYPLTPWRLKVGITWEFYN